MDNFNQIESDILNKIKNVSDRNALDSIKTEIFGKKGVITELFNKIRSLDQSQRKEYASKLNVLLKDINSLNDEIKKENLSEIENKVDELLEKLNEISGIDEIIFKLDEISSTIQEDEIDFEKITNLMKENITIFNKEVDWRKKAFGSLLAKLDQYDDAIKDTIGLRLQERLTKKQAKIVSSCRAIHRDISLNF